MALGLAVSPRGACHNRSSAYEADFSSRVDRLKADDTRGQIAMESEDFSSVLDSLIWCKFLRKAFEDFYGESARIYELVTGWPMSSGELMVAGERISNLKKLFNIREGWTRSDDTLPPRTLEEVLPDGVAEGVGLTRGDLDMMVASYYRARGWTESGLVPERSSGSWVSMTLSRQTSPPGFSLSVSPRGGRSSTSFKVPPSSPACVEEMTTRERQQQLRSALRERFPRERAHLLPALHYLQQEFGYLPGWAMEVVGWHLRVPASEIYGAATSYTELRTEQPGSHVLRVCTGLGCWTNGGEELLEGLRAGLGVSPGSRSS